MQVHNRLAILTEQKERADKRNYSYRDIAKATGISKNTVKAWHHNQTKRFDENTIVALCAWLDVELSELLVIRR